MSADESLHNRFSDSVTTRDSRIDAYLVRSPTRVYRMRTEALKHNLQVGNKYKDTGAYSEISINAEAKSRLDINKKLDQLQIILDDFVSVSQIKMVKRFFERSTNRGIPRDDHKRYNTLFDFYTNQQQLYEVHLRCSLEDRTRPDCSLTGEVKYL